MYADHIPSVAEAQRQGIVCTGVPNILLLAEDKLPPKWQTWLRGGTGSYGRIYPASKYPFDPGKRYPAHTLFVRPYTGETLADQGHVCVSLTEGFPQDVYAIAADAFDGVPNPGLNEKRTVLETHRLEPIAAAVPPDIWLGGKV